MEQSAVVKFPFEHDYANNCLARATTVNDALISVMKSWIVTKRGSRLGNMVASFLPDTIHDLVSYDDMPNLASQLKSDMSAQFPEATILDVTMTLDMSNKFVDLIVKITFTTNVTDITDFELILPTTIESHF